MLIRRLQSFLCALLWAGSRIVLDAAEIEPPALQILESHCVECHGGGKIKGGLDLRTRERLLEGGESGKVVTPGQPETSLLLASVQHQKEPHMPYKKAPLTAEEIESIAKWIGAGVPYTRQLKGTASMGAAAFEISPADLKHWAFQPIRRASVPGARGAGNPIDAFLIEKLREHHLRFSSPIGKELWLRRVSLDLIGLPPSPRETAEFLADSSPQSCERAVDRLLALPQYGERWGRHWLDLARYAESDGFEHDAARPNSWRYRDYVIRSFNEDKPCDQFIREQIAGDELWPDRPDAIIATGFNLLGPDMVDSSDQVQRRHNTLNDITDTCGLVFLGMTVGCARCHDHKFEPISQKDYYSFQAFFASARFERERPVPSAQAKARAEELAREFEAQPAVRELAELEAPARAELRREKLAKLSAEAQSAHGTAPERRTAEQANLVLETESKLALTDKEIGTQLGADKAKRRRDLMNQIKTLPKPEPLPAALALSNDRKAARVFVLHRGDYAQPGEEVTPGVPEVLRKNSPSPPAPGRGALAAWLTSPENPLTTRVLVNRVWQHHFGRGLVQTPSDFGVHAQPPTHPELLDWLAAEFMRNGWSLKKLHKLIVLSDAYRQESSPQNFAAGQAIDPENKWYWRMNRSRLEGEVLRDTLLAVSGELNPRMGGPGVYPPLPKELFAGASGWTPTRSKAEESRRSIYIFARRNLRFPFLEVFDAPDNNLSCPAREESTTAPQALTLLNGAEAARAARRVATRLEKESFEDRVRSAYALILNRAPSQKEAELSARFLQTSPLPEFCRALLNLNEFVYVE